MNKSIVSRFFSNKIFLIILSFIISFTIWFSINLDDSAQTNYVVSNIPITINLPDSAQEQGLKVFNKDELKGSVTVSGNRALIGNLNSNDIEIVPEQTESLTSAGSYTLSLVAKKKSNSLNYTIESVSPSTVYIKLDRNRTVTKKVEYNINYKIPSEYYGTVILDENEVSISGPETEIKKIDKVMIEDTIEEELTESVKEKYAVKLFDAFGEEITDTDGVEVAPSEINATISVLNVKKANVKLNASNGPSESVLSNYYEIDPNIVSLAGESSVIKNITSVNTEELDFSTLKNGEYNISKNLNIPSKCIDIDSVKTVNIKIDLTSMVKKKITITDFEIRGLDSDYTADTGNSSIEVTVYGEKKEIEALTRDDITAYIDFSDAEVSTGYKDTKVSLSLDDTSSCWIYGDYSVAVSIQ